MNISAALERLSLPWLTGYAPLRNCQNHLLKSFEAVIVMEWDEQNVPDPHWVATENLGPLTVEDAPTLMAPISFKRSRPGASHEEVRSRLAGRA